MKLVLARERRAAVRQLRKLARRLARQDRRGPGEVPPAVAGRLRRLDRNGDGWVDESELGPRR